MSVRIGDKMSAPRGGVYQAPVFDLCNTCEKRFLLDLIQEQAPDVVYDHPFPELDVLLRAIERMWGGADAKQLTAPPELIYYLAVCAANVHLIPEDVEQWRAGAAHDVYRILQGFMESVTRAIQDGAVVKHADDGVYIDLFRIPQWFYEEVVKDEQPL